MDAVEKAKTRAMDLGVKVWMIEPGRRYCIPSSANDGIAYEIIVQSNEPGDITCSCPAGVHGRVCKHVGGVLVRLDAEQAVVPQPKPERTLEDKLADLYPVRS